MPSGAAAALALALLAAGVAPARADDPAAALPATSALAPLVRGARVERHTVESLWERIDGEAELYRSHGLTTSAHALYEDPAEPDRRVDVSAFAFSDALGAFGLFAAFRPTECVVQPLGNGGCLGSYQGFFWHGRHFVLADASGAEATRRDDLRRALEAAAALLGPAPAPPAPLREFSRVAEPGSIRYQPEHLLGREALPPGLEGLAGGVPVFVSTGAPAGGSLAALEAYAKVLAGASRSERGGRTVLSGRDPALGPVTLSAGPRGIGGARAAAGAPGLAELLDALAGPDGDAQRDGP